MKKLIFFVALAISLMIMSNGCTSLEKNVLYLQNSDSIDLSLAKGLYDARIMPKDVLKIYVITPENTEVSRMFNMTRANIGGSQSGASTIDYQVSNDGKINFPILGEIYVKGMTITELQDYIAGRLTGTYLRNRPVVTVEMESFKITVLGEVGKPGQYNITKGKVNIYEALAMAGDMGMQAKRDEIKLLREDANGNKNIYILDPTSADMVNSPFYQLQQNDVLYVRQNNARIRNSRLSSEVTVWFSSLSLLMSVTAFLINLLKK
jgi:polysaccharide export outer membrane protein